MPTQRRCPDCGVEMDATKLQTQAYQDEVKLVTDESKGGLRGTLGAKEKLTPIPYVCPECQRVLFYAEDEESD
ncbi:hypothetical protein [Halorussus halophilus]|uniref:hypothetical protein n=1 Tax=Halorussus halophilus TaxID=2650975 RepID=UPI00130136F8|nr:hypothetical protein [Halorussus halophilus]